MTHYHVYSLYLSLARLSAVNAMNAAVNAANAAVNAANAAAKCVYLAVIWNSAKVHASLKLVTSCTLFYHHLHALLLTLITLFLPSLTTPIMLLVFYSSTS